MVRDRFDQRLQHEATQPSLVLETVQPKHGQTYRRHWDTEKPEATEREHDDNARRARLAHARLAHVLLGATLRAHQVRLPPEGLGTEQMPQRVSR